MPPSRRSPSIRGLRAGNPATVGSARTTTSDSGVPSRSTRVPGHRQAGPHPGNRGGFHQQPAVGAHELERSVRRTEVVVAAVGTLPRPPPEPLDRDLPDERPRGRRRPPPGLLRPRSRRWTEIQYAFGDGPRMAAARKHTAIRVPGVATAFRLPSTGVGVAFLSPVPSQRHLKLRDLAADLVATVGKGQGDPVDRRPRAHRVTSPSPGAPVPGPHQSRRPVAPRPVEGEDAGPRSTTPGQGRRPPGMGDGVQAAPRDGPLHDGPRRGRGPAPTWQGLVVVSPDLIGFHVTCTTRPPGCRAVGNRAGTDLALVHDVHEDEAANRRAFDHPTARHPPSHRRVTARVPGGAAGERDP